MRQSSRCRISALGAPPSCARVTASWRLRSRSMYGQELKEETKTINRNPAFADVQLQAVPRQPRSLRLMTYNIQTGIETNDYHHYLTRSWRHFLPNADRQLNLGRISDIITEYDF